jgi:predicted XRE-type DNA-binding protein
MIRADGDRRFKGEAVFAAQVLAAFGGEGQRERASKLLAELATGPDEMLSALARWVEHHELDQSELAEVLGLKE